MTDVLTPASLGPLVSGEGAPLPAAALEPDRRRDHGWLLVGLALALWALWASGLGRREVLNPGGWPLVAKFVRAAARPELSGSFLRSTASATLTTVAYASLGTALSVVIGSVGGLALARTTWRRRLSARAVRRRFSPGRAALVLPRGVHEAVWGLFLVNVLGRNPLVGVLAIALPYGAITTKVYADLIDEAAADVHRSLRSAGASRLGALFYGVVPATAPDLVSYAFYRFECSIRAAVVLGMIGAGGLGFQLSQSFQGLAYGEMWTSIYVLVGLGLAAEGWSWAVRRRRHPAVGRATLVAGLVLIAASWWHLRVSPATLVAPRTRELLARLAGDVWPPRLPAGGWRVLLDASLATLQLSLLTILFALLLAVPVALVSARGVLGGGPVAVAVSFLARVLALVARSIPPTVWALLVLFVVFPGMLPGALALGIYTFGVLARLLGEVVENADARPRAGLAAAGSGRLAAFAYASMPEVAPRWAVFGLYRWEVAAREAAVVGIVGAGGLGRLLAQQTAAFDYRAMGTTIASLILVTLVVDVISSRLRRGFDDRERTRC